MTAPQTPTTDDRTGWLWCEHRRVGPVGAVPQSRTIPATPSEPRRHTVRRCAATSPLCSQVTSRLGTGHHADSGRFTPSSRPIPSAMRPFSTLRIVMAVKRIVLPVPAGRADRHVLDSVPALGGAALRLADDVVALGDEVGGAPEAEVGEGGASRSPSVAAWPAGRLNAGSSSPGNVTVRSARHRPVSASLGPMPAQPLGVSATIHVSASALSRRACRRQDAALAGQDTTAPMVPPRLVHASTKAAARTHEARSRP